VNKRIVSAINAAGATARDMRRRRPHPGMRASPRPNWASSASPSLSTPVPLRRSTPPDYPGHRSDRLRPRQESDQLVNVNADTVAGGHRAALNAERLVFLTDVEGVRGADGSTIRASPPTALVTRVRWNGLRGMIPKVEACLHALSLRVQSRSSMAAGPASPFPGGSRHRLHVLNLSGWLCPFPCVTSGPQIDRNHWQP